MKMYYLKRACLWVIGVAAAFSCLADENASEQLISAKETVNNAIIKFEQTQNEHWSYSISRYENEEGDITSSIEQYSPQLSEPWLLKQMNLSLIHISEPTRPY